MLITEFDNQMANQKPFFDKQTTSIIKGVALVMMFTHHFFTFPDWWLNGIDYPFLRSVASYFRAPLRLCVSIFCFLSGYFYFYNKNKTYSYSLRKVTDILINYWGVYIPFAIIAAVTVHFVHTPVGFIMELLALDRPIMWFCWYVCFYYVFMFILPSFTKLLSRNIFFDMIVSVVILPKLIAIAMNFAGNHIGNAIIAEVIGNLEWFPIVLIGYIFASYNLFDRMTHFKPLSETRIIGIIWVVAALCIPMGRYIIPSLTLDFGTLPIIQKRLYFIVNMDIFYAPMFIFCIANLCEAVKLNYIQLILRQIGKYSFLMWLLSCGFYSELKPVFQPILYWPHNPILVLVWGLLICYVFSVILDFGLSKIIRKKNKIFFASL